MSIRGERFIVDLSDDEDADGGAPVAPQPQFATASPLSFIKDIVERAPAAPQPPSNPIFKQTTTGFPEHKKRTRISAFKQQRGHAATPPKDALDTPSAPQPAVASQRPNIQENVSSEEQERRQIDEDNKARIAAMSPEEIESERNELLSSLDPSLVQMLLNRGKSNDKDNKPGKKSNDKDNKPKDTGIEDYLKRANMDDGRGDTGIDLPADFHKDTKHEPTTTSPDDPDATTVPKPAGRPVTATKAVRWVDDDDAEPADPGHLQPATSFEPHTHAHPTADPALPDGPTIHFPTPPSAPDLDPSDPSFLTTLHSTYFPSLPADPSKLAWMAPLPTPNSPADLDSSYSPSHPALPASALRFDFRGALLPPRIARAMPVSKGLHHHGDAPEAAGYTVPELARLARSAFPAQRCLAFQTLGRVLFRLGKGEWGAGTEMSMGLWRCVEEGGVLPVLQQAAAAEGGHRGVGVYAVEAVWLWQRGGGKVMGAI